MSLRKFCSSNTITQEQETEAKAEDLVTPKTFVHKYTIDVESGEVTDHTVKPKQTRVGVKWEFINGRWVEVRSNYQKVEPKWSEEGFKHFEEKPKICCCSKKQEIKQPVSEKRIEPRSVKVFEKDKSFDIVVPNYEQAKQCFFKAKKDYMEYPTF